MLVNKAEDTSSKTPNAELRTPNAENKVVEAKPESSTKTENKMDDKPKRQDMGEGQKAIGNVIFEKNDRTSLLHGGAVQPQQFYRRRLSDLNVKARHCCRASLTVELGTVDSEIHTTHAAARRHCRTGAALLGQLGYHGFRGDQQGRDRS